MPPIFHTAILRRPCPEMVNGITTAGLGTPDFTRALEQHSGYAAVLQHLGLDVRFLESAPAYPDSVFIEDVAVCTPEFALITRPGAPTRTGETEGMRQVLKEFYIDIAEIRAPGTLEGGDVMRSGSHWFVGLSDRTNEEGARQLIALLEEHGYTGSIVKFTEMLHLKTGVSFLENNNLLVCGEFTDHPAFSEFNRIEIPPGEAYAANSLWINGTVLVPAGFPETAAKIRQAGYPVIETDVSEFRKLDGGLSCLSLRF
jgi:dimethylargininase